MNRSIRCLAQILIVASTLMGPGAAGTAAAEHADVILASGTLDGRFLARALFHIGEFWMRVPPGTEFNRWLSQGINRKVVVTLMTNADRFGDDRNVRILSGTLMHGISPKPTPAEIDVIGRLPAGNLPVVHVVFLRDELTGSLGAVTFETADFVTAAKFGVHDNTDINIVIEIE